MAKTNIKIKPSKRGTFTAAAKRRGQGVQSFASQVLANKERYSPAMVKKANFARNAATWKHAYGGQVLPEYDMGGSIVGGVGSGIGMGASIGSIFPGPGTAIGAGVGALIGGISGYMQGNAEEAAQREANRLAQKNRDTEYAFANTDFNKGVTYHRMAKGGMIGPESYIPVIPSEKVETPTYKPITARTAYLENKRLGVLPADLKYKDFSKNMSPYLEAMGASGDHRYDPNMATGAASGFTKRLTETQTGLTGKGYKKYPDGGEVDGNPNNDPFIEKLLTRNSYAHNLTELDSFLWDNYLQNTQGKDVKDWTDLEYAMAANRYHILNEAPKNKAAMDTTSMDKLKYLDNLMGRLNPYVTKENVDMLTAGNGPINTLKKINFVSDLPLYKADLDSIQKYMPNFYEGNNLGLSKPFLSGDAIPEYPMGGKIPYYGTTPATANAELEGGESGITPTGDNFAVEGPSHAGGGVPMNLPEGTQVYSDRIKVPGTKQTYSDANKKIMKRMSKSEKVLDDPYATKTSKRSAELNLSSDEKKQRDLFLDQERVKQQKDMRSAKGKYPKGGVVTAADIEDLINANFDNLRESYKNVKGGLGDYTTPDGQTYNTSDLLQQKQSRVLDALRNDITLLKDPKRLRNLYNAIQSMQGGEQVQAQSAGIPWRSNFGPYPMGSDYTTQQTPTVTTSQAGIPWKSNFGRYPMGSDIAGGSSIPTVTPDSTPSATTNTTPFATGNAFDFATQGPDFEGYNSPLKYRQPSLGMRNSSAAPAGGSPSNITADGYDEALAFLNDNKNLAGDASMNWAKAGNIATTAATALPALYNIGQGLFGKADTVDPNDYTNISGLAAANMLKGRKYNIEPVLAAINRSFNAGRRDVSNASRTRGELLSNVGGLAARKSAAESQAYATKQNMENQYRAEAANALMGLGNQNASMRWQAGMYNKQAQAAKEGMLGTGLSQVSELIQSRQRDKLLATNRSAADAQRWQALRQMFPDTYKS